MAEVTRRGNVFSPAELPDAALIGERHAGEHTPRVCDSGTWILVCPEPAGLPAAIAAAMPLFEVAETEAAYQSRRGILISEDDIPLASHS